MALMRYYLQAPGIVGGGIGKARTLATQTASVNPEAARLMQARLDASDDKPGAAEAAVLAMAVSSNEAIADGQRDLLIALANDHMNAKRLADAERVLREAVKRFPDSTSAPYSLARVQQEQGKHREAVAGFEQVLAKDPHSATWYRIGQSQQALGEKAKAASAYERALALGEQLPKGAKADAEKQLKVLK
jgi:tetratricopeptide (TPR) repeat protein